VAAADYRAFSYPGELSATEQTQLRQAEALHPDIPKKRLERYIHDASEQKIISNAIVNGQDASEFLPPLLAHRDAWNAYINQCIEEQKHTNPPTWLIDELLEPLGFDQAVICGLTENKL
jgi:Asp-tRNA(Asn)/Glu-tRNA(Gln) amidotransferase B subunit